LSIVKGNKSPRPKEHDKKIVEEKLANRHSWYEVKAIMVAELDPIQAIIETFPPPQLENPMFPPYFIFCKPKDVVITKVDTKFIALPKNRR